MAQPDSYDTGHNTTLDLTLPGSPADVITGVNPENRDYDPDNSIEGRVFDDILTAFLPGGLSSGQTSEGGAVELNPDGTFSYTPPADFVGSDSFTYYVTDGYGNSTVVQVAIAVGLPEIPPPPLPDPIVWEVGGCPALMEWLADELGVEPENIQHYGLNAVSDSRNTVGAKTTLAYQGDMQLCQICAQLKDSVQVLSDPNGVRMGALASVVAAQLGPLAGPPTPEQMDTIATALAAAAEDTQYASASEFVEAVVTYVTTLTDNLGYDAVDAVALFMENHGAPITEDETVDLYIGVLLSNIAVQLEATGG
ncbi:MAG: Ig-like domain-containing protein [Planctomycetota bacterium]